MNITILCEGRTERVFKETLKKFVDAQLGDLPKPRLHFISYDGAIPTDEKLKRVVEISLETGAMAVIALTDVYPMFISAADAKKRMINWVPRQPKFYPHVALYDFEAWLLPYWEKITQLAGKEANPFAANPETVNGKKPPAHRLKALFETGKSRDSYSKPRDAGRILRSADLMVAITACPELKAFVNTILKLCDGTEIK